MGGTRALLGEAQRFYREECCSIKKRRYGWYQGPSGRGPALLARKSYCKEMVVFKKEDMGKRGLFWKRPGPFIRKDVVVFKKEDMGGTGTLLEESWPS